MWTIVHCTQIRTVINDFNCPLYPINWIQMLIFWINFITTIFCFLRALFLLFLDSGALPSENQGHHSPHSFHPPHCSSYHLLRARITVKRCAIRQCNRIMRALPFWYHIHVKMLHMVCFPTSPRGPQVHISSNDWVLYLYFLHLQNFCQFLLLLLVEVECFGPSLPSLQCHLLCSCNKHDIFQATRPSML